MRVSISKRTMPFVTTTFALSAVCQTSGQFLLYLTLEPALWLLLTQLIQSIETGVLGTTTSMDAGLVIISKTP